MSKVSVAALESIAKGIPVGVIAVEKKENKIVYVNQYLIRLLGFNPTGLTLEEYDLTLAKPCRSSGVEPYLYKQLPLAKALLHGQTVYNQEVIVQKPDKTELTILSNTTPLMDFKGEVIGALGIFEDITERKQTEKALEKERLTLKGIIESTDTMIAYLDVKFNFIIVNSAYANNSGHSVEELVGKNHFDLFPNKENQKIFEKVRDTGKPVKRLDRPFEYTNQPQRGVTYWDWTLSAVKDDEGEVHGLVLTLMETTERKKAEKALKESETRLNLAQKIAHIGSWEYDAKEDRAVWSKELFNIFGLKPQTYGPSFDDYMKLVYPQDCENMNMLMGMGLFKGKVGDSTSFAYRIIRPDGSIRTIHSERVIREVDRNGKATRIMGAEQDITERRKSEEILANYSANLEKLVEQRTNQLKNAERLAAIGQTAGMVGHDLRNPLQAIVGEVYLAKSELKLMPKNEHKTNLQENITAIEEQITYMDKIVSDLQTFVKPVVPQTQTVNLKPLIIALLAQADIPGNIRTSFQVKEPLTVTADPQLLKRVLINLVTNAVQAMPHGGELIINVQPKNAGRIQIDIKDTGVGIPDVVKPKLFTPLFTTKAKGQGFGLAVCKRVLEAQDGTISFESQQNKGTTFAITLPCK